MRFAKCLARRMLFALVLAALVRAHFRGTGVGDSPCDCADCLSLDRLATKIGDAVGYAEAMGEEAGKLLEEFEKRERQPAEVYVRIMAFMACFGEGHSPIGDGFNAIFGEVMKEAYQRVFECRKMLEAAQQRPEVRETEACRQLASFEHALCAAERKIALDVAVKMQRVLFLLHAKRGELATGRLQAVHGGGVQEHLKSVGDRI